MSEKTSKKEKQASQTQKPSGLLNLLRMRFNSKKTDLKPTSDDFKEKLNEVSSKYFKEAEKTAEKAENDAEEALDLVYKTNGKERKPLEEASISKAAQSGALNAQNAVSAKNNDKITPKSAKNEEKTDKIAQGEKTESAIGAPKTQTAVASKEAIGGNLGSGVDRLKEYLEDYKKSKADEAERKTQEEADYVQKLQELADKIAEEASGVREKYDALTDYDYYKDKLPEIPESLGLTEKELPEFDKDKQTAEAESKANAEKQLKVDEINADFAKTKTEIENEAKDAEKSSAELAKKLVKNYDAQREQNEYELLRRGLARSSVAVLSLNNIEAEKVQQLNSLAVSLSEKLDSANSKLLSAQADLAKSLESADKEALAKAQELFERALTDYEKEKQEAIDFNNNIKKLEAEYQIKRTNAMETSDKLAQKFAEAYAGVNERTKKEEMYSTLDKLVDGMTREELVDLLYKVPNLQRSLGDLAYGYLYNKAMKK